MSPDFRELLSTFNAHGVDYIVVGAHALAAHGHVRATRLDLVANKRAAGRLQDLADVERLEAMDRNKRKI